MNFLEFQSAAIKIKPQRLCTALEAQIAPYSISAPFPYNIFFLQKHKIIFSKKTPQN